MTPCTIQVRIAQVISRVSAQRSAALANSTLDESEKASTLPDRESADLPLLPATLTVASESHRRPSESPIQSVTTPRSEKTHAHSSERTSSPSSSLRKGSLLSKIGTLRPERFRSQSKYHEIQEEPGTDISLEPIRGSGGDLDQDDTADSVGMDISSFGGPESLSRLATIKSPSRLKSQLRSDSRTSELESKGHLTAGIGYGMDDVVEATLNVPVRAVTPSRQDSKPVWKNLGGTIHRSTTKGPGQQVAEMSGQVVAIDEVPMVDMSNVEGGMQPRKPTTDFEQIANSATQSYYFPPDPDMPDWRPPTMMNRYVILLVCIALVFGAVTEYLTQLSLQRAPDDGLLVFRDPREVSDLDWFAWKYMPTMVILLYGIMWQATDFEVRRLEPYYQLSKPGGATAEESLNMGLFDILELPHSFQGISLPTGRSTIVFIFDYYGIRGCAHCTERCNRHGAGPPQTRQRRAEACKHESYLGSCDGGDILYRGSRGVMADAEVETQIRLAG